jgi:DNA-binding transcriptional MerR regulator/methylmalonyl-CoA mutase cobalamin-binding subunit
MVEAQHPIKLVARRTGLSSHVIRIWEKRYNAVEPCRSQTNRRLYSDEDIERLSLLRDITKAGHTIGLVAGLPTDKLRQMAQEAAAQEVEVGVAIPRNPSPVLERCLAAIRAFDSRGLEEALKTGATELGAQGLLQKVVAPLSQTLGEMWREGSITAAHEHFATAAIRIFLGHAARPFAPFNDAPVLTVATPAGQLHELGALLAGAVAANLGWHVVYLGASLPAAEIASAVRQHEGAVLALSLVYPEDDPRLADELARLRELLPEKTVVLAGGRAAAAYQEAIEKCGALIIRDLAHLGSVLDNLRKPARKTKR